MNETMERITPQFQEDNSSPVLTISVAAYNVEEYLEETLSSLCQEEILNDIEILVIDDGSKDQTGTIAKHYEKMFPQTVHYIYKENGGHGSTINKGLELATGRYFRVVDGDDWVEPEGFCNFVKKLEQTDSDMVLSDYCKVSPDGSNLFQFLQFEPGRCYSISDNSLLSKVLVTLHSLTVKTKLLKEANVRITEHCFYVDIEFIVWSIYLSHNLTYVDIPVYMYRIGSEGQSINKSNMLKNVGMQETVALNLGSLYQSIFEDSAIEDGKLRCIALRIKRSVGATIRTYFFMENWKEAKKKIIDFDRRIQRTSKALNRQLRKDPFFKAVRFNNYSLLLLVRYAYLVCLKAKR